MKIIKIIILVAFILFYNTEIKASPNKPIKQRYYVECDVIGNLVENCVEVKPCANNDVSDEDETS